MGKTKKKIQKILFAGGGLAVILFGISMVIMMGIQYDVQQNSGEYPEYMGTLLIFSVLGFASGILAVFISYTRIFKN